MFDPRSLAGPVYLAANRFPVRAWVYTTLDDFAAASAEGYFANGAQYGLELGDLVTFRQLLPPTAYIDPEPKGQVVQCAIKNVDANGNCTMVVVDVPGP